MEICSRRGCDGAQAVHDLGGGGAIGGEVGRQAAQMGAEGAGASHGHGGADAEAAGLVGAGGDDAAAVRRAADGEGGAAQGGVFLLLDGAVEGVEIKMEDGACRAFGRHGV